MSEASCATSDADVHSGLRRPSTRAHVNDSGGSFHGRMAFPCRWTRWPARHNRDERIGALGPWMSVPAATIENRENTRQRKKHEYPRGLKGKSILPQKKASEAVLKDSPRGVGHERILRTLSSPFRRFFLLLSFYFFLFCFFPSRSAFNCFFSHLSLLIFSLFLFHRASWLILSLSLSLLQSTIPATAAISLSDKSQVVRPPKRTKGSTIGRRKRGFRTESTWRCRRTVMCGACRRNFGTYRELYYRLSRLCGWPLLVSRSEWNVSFSVAALVSLAETINRSRNWLVENERLFSSSVPRRLCLCVSSRYLVVNKNNIRNRVFVLFCFLKKNFIAVCVGEEKARARA